MVELKHSRHAVGQSAYHLVWKPKYNLQVFRHRYPREVITCALKEVAKKWKILIYELEVMPDHIHIFVEIPSTMSISFCLQILKGGSARLFFKRCTVWKKQLTTPKQNCHLWSPGKFFRSVGSVTTEAVANYIKNSNDWNFEFLDKGQTKLEAF